MKGILETIVVTKDVGVISSAPSISGNSTATTLTTTRPAISQVVINFNDINEFRRFTEQLVEYEKGPSLEIYRSLTQIY